MMTNKAELSDVILKRTSQEMVDVIYETLETLDDVLRKNDIGYTIFCGTMLGSVRHGGLIPWDDDGDIAIRLEDRDRLLELKDVFKEKGYTLEEHPVFGYRLWNPKKTMTRIVDQVEIPFVDIFLIESNDHEHFYITEDAKIFFPGEPLPFGCFDRLIDVPFGHLTLRGLNKEDSLRHLNESFGNDWNEVAWRDFDHVTADEFPRIRVNLDQPQLRLPVLHSKHQAILTTPFKTLNNNISNGH